MTEFALPKGVEFTVRLWIDELPAGVDLPSDAKRTKHVFAGARAIARHTSVAVEMFQPLGGYARYGLLGATFRLDSSEVLRVSVPSQTPKTGRCYEQSLAAQLDEVEIGGTLEYAAAVIASIQTMRKTSLPSGWFDISSMAHGRVGSSPFVFEMLARAVVRLMIRDDDPLTADEVATLLLDT